MTLQALLAVGVGWLFGLLTHVVIEWNRRLRRTSELRRSVALELDELRYRLAMVTFSLADRANRVDRSLLTVLEPVVEKYDGPLANAEFREQFRALSQLSDAEMTSQPASSGTPSQGVLLKQLQVPLLLSTIGDLLLLPPEFLRLSLDVLRQLGAINEEIAFANENFDRTFDPAITGSNRVALQANIEAGYLNVSRMCKDLILTINRVPRLRRGA